MYFLTLEHLLAEELCEDVDSLQARLSHGNNMCSLLCRVNLTYFDGFASSP